MAFQLSERPRRRGQHRLRDRRRGDGAWPVGPEHLEVRHALAAVAFTGTPYTQAFDTLGPSPSTWANDSTLAAWSLFDSTGAGKTSILVGDGSTGTGSFYNFGVTSGADRALGAIASGGTAFGSPSVGGVAGWMAIAVANATGLPQASFTVRYDGEQWRNGGAGTSQKLTVEYGYGATFATVASWASAGASFEFTSPQTVGTAAPLDGNQAANRVASIGGTITPAAAWAAGATLWIRWGDANDAGNDHGLAIDNVSFSLPTTVVSAPSAPTITGITAGDGRLTVAFAAPASDGGGAISAYQYSLDDGATWVTPSTAVTSSPLVIGGLVNGSDYAVRLRGVNSAGPGAASAMLTGRPVGIGTLRIVNYNITAADQLPRAGLATLVQAMAAETVNGLADQVDLLTIQEVQSQAVTSASVAATLNAIYGAGTYSFGSLNGATTGAGTQGVVYNTAALRLLEERAIGTTSGTGGPRQTIRYRFQPKDGDATSVFYVYNSHLKSLDTATDAGRRDVEVTAIRADADALPEGTNILYVGDFNLYRSSEPAYQRFLSAGPGQAFDPMARPGDWHSNPAFVDTFTQAPLVTPPPGMTGGGLDDRFDFQLVSGEVMAPGGFTYVAGSYHTFGNNGSVPRNGNINDPRSTALPGLANRIDVLTALTTFSDHLPVVADYTYETIAAVTPALAVTPGTLAGPLSTTAGTASTSATFSVGGTGLTGAVTVTAPPGLEVSTAVGSGYASSISIASIAGSLPATTIYARLSANAPVGSYDARAIVVSGGGASPKTVSTTASGNAVVAAAGDLFFSEVVEGTGNNKYLEISNGGSSAASLADYQVRLFANGAATPTQTQSLGSLAGAPSTLAPGATLVLAGTSAALVLPVGVASYASGAVAFNGDDAVALWKVSTAAYVDIFGVIGSDPGTAWTDGLVTTLNSTLRRAASVTAGVTTNPATFSTLASEWVMFPVDTVAGLGSHVAVFDVAAGQTLVEGTSRSGATAIVKRGPGVLVLNAVNSHTGGVAVQGGTLVVRNPGALGAGPVSVAAGATLLLDAGTAGITAGSLTAVGLVDIGTGGFTVSAGLDVKDVLALLAAGRGDGFWTGTSGIGSSAARTAIATGVPRGVGWADNGDGSFTFAFSAPGDTNLDATVDILDAANILSGGAYDTGVTASWAQGDTTYDGIVDILDIADFMGSGLFDQPPYRTTSAAAIGSNALPVPATGSGMPGVSPRDLAFATLAADPAASAGAGGLQRRRARIR